GETLIKDAKELVHALSSSPAQEVVQKAIADLKAAPTADVAAIERKLHAFAGATQLELEKWKTDFKAAQDRAEQWFTMNARWWTVGLAFPAAFLLQLDTFQLFSQISTDDALRNGLVNLAAAVEKRADEAMNQVFPGTVYFAVLKQMRNDDEDVKKFDMPQESDAQTESDAATWLRKQASHVQPSLDETKQRNLIDRFRSLVPTKSGDRLEYLKKQFGEISGLYSQSKLQLIPKPYWQGWGAVFSVFQTGKGWRHIAGMLVTGLLLTLGVPFWFNLLKSLTNLRSS